MVVVNSLEEAFEKLKDTKIAFYGIITAIIYILLALISIIPILGAIIQAYVFPRVVAWYYNKAGLNVKPNYNVAFEALLTPLLVLHIGLIIATVSEITSIKDILLENTNALNDIGISMYLQLVGTNIIILLVTALISLVLGILLLYTVYGSIVGKVNQLKIDIVKSGYLVIASIIIGIIAFIITILLAFIPVIGGILVLIFRLLVKAYTLLVYGILAQKL